MASITIILIAIIISINGSQQQEQQKNFLVVGTLDQCKGTDSANYTMVEAYTINSMCDPNSITADNAKIISCSASGEKTTISFVGLANTIIKIGAWVYHQSLLLVTSGSLEGKYLYIKNEYQRELYLKKCSSVLGNSGVPTKYITFMIADNIDISIFVNNDSFATFKKSASTICTGKSVIV